MNALFSNNTKAWKNMYKRKALRVYSSISTTFQSDSKAIFRLRTLDYPRNSLLEAGILNW